MRRRKVSMVGAVAAAAAMVLVTPGLAWAGTSDPYEPDVVVARAADGKRAYFPGLTKLADGTLVAAYREGAGHIGQDGRLLVTESTDSGRTWSTPRVAVDSDYDERDPKLMVTRSGVILMSYFVTDWTEPGPYTIRGTHVVRSLDGGRTWSEPIKVGSAMDCGCGVPGYYYAGLNASHGEAVELPDGDLLLPLYGSLPDGTSQATVVRSTDGGLTWPKESEVLLGRDSAFAYQEPTLTPLKSGELIVLLRTSINIAYLSRSKDFGRTWTAPERTGIPASSHHLLTLANGEVLLTYGDLSKRFSPGRPTVGRVVHDPEGSWAVSDLPEPRLLYDSSTAGVTADQANPASVEVSPGRFLTLTYDHHRAMLVGVFTDRADYRAGGQPPLPGTLDLRAMHEAGELTVETNLTWTSTAQPTRGPLAPLDGQTTFFHSATLNDPGATGTYVVRFTDPQQVESVGVVLQPGSGHEGTISVSSDGQTWREVTTVSDARTIDLRWVDVKPAAPVVGVRVDVRDPAGGWPQLTELAVRARP
jgi:hypothetical protein